MMRVITSILFLIQALNARAKRHGVHEPVYPITPYPNITITVWTTNNCTLQKTDGPIDLHSGQGLNMIPTAENYVTGTVSNSYWLSRDLIDTERLDWSICADGTDSCSIVGVIKAECTTFELRTSPDSNGHALLAHTCYLLSPGAQVSHLS